jgi:hypothetical protein
VAGHTIYLHPVQQQWGLVPVVYRILVGVGPEMSGGCRLGMSVTASDCVAAYSCVAATALGGGVVKQRRAGTAFKWTSLAQSGCRHV